MILKLRTERRGIHVHVSVFAGPFHGNLAHCGELVFRPEEFLKLKKTLEIGENATSTSINHVCVEEMPAVDLPWGISF